MHTTWEGAQAGRCSEARRLLGTGPVADSRWQRFPAAPHLAGVQRSSGSELNHSPSLSNCQSQAAHETPADKVGVSAALKHLPTLNPIRKRAPPWALWTTPGFNGCPQTSLHPTWWHGRLLLSCAPPHYLLAIHKCFIAGSKTLCDATNKCPFIRCKEELPLKSPLLGPHLCLGHPVVIRLG